MRYAIDSQKIISEIGWKPDHDFRKGIKKTILWYLENQEWISSHKSK